MARVPHRLMLPPTRPLESLRRQVDAADHELLQVLSRRMALVKEIGALKRSLGMQIRDVEREREVLRDRVEAATALGLPPGEMESLFRLILRASRDYQAALQVEVAAQHEPLTVAVIGGAGKMGRVLAQMFHDLGHTVLVADVNTDLTGEAAAARADVVVVSVPIESTEHVIAQVGPHVRPSALLMDVTSVKRAPMAAMLQATRASVVGTHPMFGPNVHTLQGQRAVICRGRGDVWADWVEHAFTAHGMVITETTAEHHDRVMSVVQVLTHFQTQVMGLTLARMGVPLEETLRYTSPVYLLELYTTARHFAQSPSLYGPIEMLNPRSSEVTATLKNVATELAEVIARGDQPAFDAMFAEVRAFFGSFTSVALEQSSYLIDRIVERT